MPPANSAQNKPEGRVRRLILLVSRHKLEAVLLVMSPCILFATVFVLRKYMATRSLTAQSYYEMYYDATAKTARLEATYGELLRELETNKADLAANGDFLSKELLHYSETEKSDAKTRILKASVDLAASKRKNAEYELRLANFAEELRVSQMAIDDVNPKLRFLYHVTSVEKKLTAAQQALADGEQQLSSAVDLQRELLAELAAARTTVGLPPGIKEIRKVFYATDRNTSGQTDTGPMYGQERGNDLRYGVCTVSIPEDHRMGRLETPSIWRLEIKSDPKRDIVFLSATELREQQFYDNLRSAVAAARSREIFIFVHGFANSFIDAARRTAQLSYDLGYSGIPLMYSWPSKGSISLDGYRHDETNVDWTAPHLKKFLLDLAKSSGATHINLVAHSMGNRVLGDALAAIEAEMQQQSRPTFNQVILTAPDIDADVFKDTLAPAMRKVSERLTLYASSNDEALKFSKRIHGGYRRAGDNVPEMVLTSDLDSIDVSAVDTYFFSVGHSYFSDNRSVISDLFLLFRDGSPPDKRNLLPQSKGPLKYWLFRP